ncbi:hypothetical protein POTOM_019188 [Populus tomentosa]|uniref:Uncharacterized protein n=1 Tax=Populus tomentosa TaxID=118781 RepID=A0A8X8A0M0_POPTO|nr:hypothetical protein POTOM_019188 [Populus tomentosa]
MLKALLGLATFCRVKSAFSSSEVALPVAAEEGFTRFVDWSKRRKGLQEFVKDGLVKVDGSLHMGLKRRVKMASEDMERIEFKMKFFKILQIWKMVQVYASAVSFSILNCSAEEEHACAGRRVQVLNNLILGVGLTIFCAGPCLHQEHDLQGHNFLSCHVKECDILTEYKGWKPGDTSRWKGGWGIRLEGSDHAPVYTSLEESMISPHIALRLYLPDIYLPMIHGVQQTLGMTIYGDATVRKSPNLSIVAENSSTKTSPRQAEPNSRNHSSDSHAMDDKSSSPNYCKVNSRTVSQDQNEGNDGLLERQKNSNPVCKGHKEPCVARIVKKPGPTLGRRLWQIVFDLSGDAPFHFKFFWSCGDLHPILKQIEATSNGLLPNPGTNDCL